LGQYWDEPCFVEGHEGSGQSPTAVGCNTGWQRQPLAMAISQTRLCLIELLWPTSMDLSEQNELMVLQWVAAKRFQAV